MKSLQESLIFELNSSTYASAHDKALQRNGGKEDNRSRRFAVAAGKALMTELKKKGLVDKKTGKVKSDKTIEAVSTITSAAKTNPIIKNAIKEDPESSVNLQKKSGKTIILHIPGIITEEGEYRKPFDVKLSNKKYVIYKDPYRGHTPHLASIGELFSRIGYISTLDDFEGFGPKDIIYASNDPKEIIRYAVNRYGDWNDDDETDINDLGTADSEDWAQSVLDGDEEFDTEEEYDTVEGSMLGANAFVDNNGYVYWGYNMEGDDATETYQDYIKRVFNK